MGLVVSKAFNDGCVIVQPGHVNRLIRRQSENKERPDGLLWMHVLMQAVVDLGHASYKKDAAAFFGTDGFVSVCFAAGVDEEWVMSLVGMIGKTMAIDVSEDDVMEDGE